MANFWDDVDTPLLIHSFVSIRVLKFRILSPTKTQLNDYPHTYTLNLVSLFEANGEKGQQAWWWKPKGVRGTN